MVLIHFIQNWIPYPPNKQFFCHWNFLLLSGHFGIFILLSHVSSFLSPICHYKIPLFQAASLPMVAPSLAILWIFLGHVDFCRTWQFIISCCRPSNAGSTWQQQVRHTQVPSTEPTAGSPKASSMLVPLHSSWVNVGNAGPLRLTSTQKRLEHPPNFSKDLGYMPATDTDLFLLPMCDRLAL